MEDVDLRGSNLDSTTMIRTILDYSRLKNASFKGSVLTGASFKETNMRNTDFSGAIFTNAKHLTYNQLSKVKTLYNTKGIPDSIETKLRQNKPELFDDPN